MRAPSKRRTCSDMDCTVHRWPRRKGPHMRGELVPASGPVEGLVVSTWDDAGRREAYRLAYDPASQTWSERLPLPPRPRAGHAAAVERARRFVRAGVLA